MKHSKAMVRNSQTSPMAMASRRDDGGHRRRTTQMNAPMSTEPIRNGDAQHPDPGKQVAMHEFVLPPSRL